MKILITGSCGHIGSYLSDNIYKIKNVSKAILVDNLKSNRFDSLFNAATIETRISGAEVANATIVRPITMIGIFRICAIDATPLTK